MTIIVYFCSAAFMLVSAGSGGSPTVPKFLHSEVLDHSNKLTPGLLTLKRCEVSASTLSDWAFRVGRGTALSTRVSLQSPAIFSVSVYFLHKPLVILTRKHTENIL